MFAVKRVLRSKLSLKNYLYTSSILRCDKPENPDSEKGKPKSRKKKTTASSKPITVCSDEGKNPLTAEVKAMDYANFKSQKSSKVKLYSNNSSEEEKSDAKKALKALVEEIESEGEINIPTNNKFQELSVEKFKNEVKSEDKLVKSAKLVASKLGGDVKKTEKDILGYLKSLELKIEKRKVKEENADIINKEKQTSRGKRDFMAGRGDYFRRSRSLFRDSADLEEDQMDFHKTNEGYRNEMSDGRIYSKMKIKDFLSGRSRSGFQPLGVFKASELVDEGPKLKIWDELKEWELKFATKIPPRNHFQELIQWTEEGKLWRFPIDNDQDNELEAGIDFTEHVFLEKHLEPWCPKKGPLRHFMDLVLTGLSKNHHFTVEEKKEHIYWYRDYFEAKKKLLLEMGALDSGKVLQECEESKSKPENPA